MQSVWEKYLQPVNTIPQGDDKIIELDHVVVGGGIAGIMCAYMLSQQGKNVTLIEATHLLGGVTSNTTAHVTSLQGKYRDIPTNRKRREYFESQQDAIEGIVGLIEQHKIDCDFRRVDGIIFGRGKEIKKEFKVMKKFCPDVVFEQNRQLPFGEYDCIALKNQAHFNPIKFCYGIIDAGKFDIIENCRIKKVKLLRKRLVAENRIIKYKKLVLATGFPIVNIRGIYAFKMYKSSSYAISRAGVAPMDAIYSSIEGDGLTYRDSEDGLIVGGLDHRTGRHKCDEYFKKLGKSDFRWAANDCMTFDGVPYAGRLLRLFARNTFVITGFAKNGMTNSFAAAKVVTDTMNKNKNWYKRLMKPTRVLNVRVWGAFLWNFLQNGKSLLFGLFSGKKRRCPHMGCRIKFNPNTQTFDCPCHGSRLTTTGDIIVSPTVRANEKLSQKNHR